MIEKIGFYNTVRTYLNDQTGNYKTVKQTGKSFAINHYFAATKNSKEETYVTRHKTWSAVEKKLVGFDPI